MKRHLLKALSLSALLATSFGASAQLIVDRTKYPDYSSAVNPDPSLLRYSTQFGAAPLSQRPAYVNNMATKFFPPVFNQDGGSCGSASRICYMFTYELNAYRNLDALSLANRYPSHFVWLLTNGNSGKDEFVKHVGVPSAELYGGTTYSSLFGNQDTSDPHFGWMTGYDKWFSAMHNRMLSPRNMPVNVKTEEGREALKNWLWNHNGDPDFHAGGIAGIGVASAGDWQPIPKTDANDEAGVTGLYYVKRWGEAVDHALTIVGYDDRIEFDLDGDGVYGEKDADEVGAWIVVNSWGAGWCNAGMVYCPYGHATPQFRHDKTTDTWSPLPNWWQPELYYVRKDYRPLRTIKLLMDYSHRSEICLGAGVSTDVNATEPEKSIEFEHFKYAGDGQWGNANPAPEVPMLGRWADGKFHTEPMEFGYDLTDLTAGVDKSRALKYFFIVNTREWAQGSGHIRGASIMDYDVDPAGVEVPFDLGKDGAVEIKNAGERTIISVVVPGQQFYAPENAAIVDGTKLVWNSPKKSVNTLEGYNISHEGKLISTVGPDVHSFDISATGEGTYSVTALYEGGRESAATSAVTAIILTEKTNPAVRFNKSGFTIPEVFAQKYPEATIEFWLRASSLVNWNQQAGPGWGKFMMHANANGSFTAGWQASGEERCSTPAGSLRTSFTHIAVVVERNKVFIYINGNLLAEHTSQQFSGIGGFGDFVFGSANPDAAMNGIVDELRIWNTARTTEQIRANYKSEFSGELLPEGLIAYYKGDLIGEGSDARLRDFAGGHHATMLYPAFEYTNAFRLNRLTAPTAPLAAEIKLPEEGIYAGVPATLTASRSESVNTMTWTAEGAGVKGLRSAKATLTFDKPGEYTISLTAGSTATGEEITTERKITVLSAPAPDAGFAPTTPSPAVGERVTFLVKHPADGYSYEWSMPGADNEKAYTVNAAATYMTAGEYTVKLTVTSPDGAKATESCKITAREVAPVADFTVAPAVVIKGESVAIRDNSKFGPTDWTWHLGSSAVDYKASGNELYFKPEQPGVYDVTLYAKNSTGADKKVLPRGLIVTNADSRNGLTFSQSGATVKASNVPFDEGQRSFTIEWWMNPGKLSDFCLGIGDREETLFLKTAAAGAMLLYVDGKFIGTSDNFVIPGQWHHYAVTFTAGHVRMLRDGIVMKDGSLEGVRTVPALSHFAIGSPAAQMTGAIDEFRIWGRDFAARPSELKGKLHVYANAPLDNMLDRAKKDNLLICYPFNQTGGNVTDISGNGNTGIRSGFGPDGDAWGLSTGVFCLNLDEKVTKDVTADYLRNYQSPFRYDDAVTVNPGTEGRFKGITDWTLENTNVNGNTITGVHVDMNKASSFTATSGWDGFATMTDHKAYQTVTLPAGHYVFSAIYGASEGQPWNSYMAVAEGAALPATAGLENDALAYAKMGDKMFVTENSIEFFIPEEKTVSLGLVINMAGNRCLTIDHFTLTHNDAVTLESDPTGIDAIAPDDSVDSGSPVAKGIYDLTGRRLNRIDRAGIYIIDGRKTIVK